MANTKSAEKQNRQAHKHRARNQGITSAVRTQVRKFREALASGDAAKTKTELVSAIRAAVHLPHLRETLPGPCRR